VVVLHAAREAARAAAVGDDGTSAARSAAGGLVADHLAVQLGRSGELVTARVTYVEPMHVPLLASVLHSVTVEGKAAMRREP
jgi:hypothetical protein